MPLDYSPDGRRLVFYRAVRAEPDFPTDIDGSLWVVNADGTGARKIQTGRTRLAPWGRWSPDGKHIVFGAERGSPRGALWTTSADGSHLKKLFEDKDGRFPIVPTWSPDGGHVLFGLDPTSDSFTHPANGIYAINADGTAPTLVVGTRDFKSSLTWSD